MCLLFVYLCVHVCVREKHHDTEHKNISTRIKLRLADINFTECVSEDAKYTRDHHSIWVKGVKIHYVK